EGRRGLGNGLDEIFNLRIENLRLRKLVEIGRSGDDSREHIEEKEEAVVEVDVEMDDVDAVDGADEGQRTDEQGWDGIQHEEGQPHVDSQQDTHSVDPSVEGNDKNSFTTPLSLPKAPCQDEAACGGELLTLQKATSVPALSGESRLYIHDEVAGTWEEDTERAATLMKKRRLELLEDVVEKCEAGGASPKRKKKARGIPPNLLCRQCGTTRSPEWRKGPEGRKTLCNACGLAYAKERKKVGKNGGGHETEVVVGREAA
ncbi:blue light receptor, partial [Rhizophlyctis rosea]